MSLVVDIRKKLALFDLEVSFEAGNETLGFLGASGCGKSMTLRCVAGVETPDEGKIILNGQVLFDSAAKVNLTPQQRKTALLFQNYQLFPNLTVEQNIAAGIDLSVAVSVRKELVAQQMRRFSLEGYERSYPLQLSGGQQQRVALARMLAAQPGILMLDEPFAALDAHLKSQLEQELLDLFDAYEGSILYVSHDIDEAFRFCDRIAVVGEGRIREIGPTQQIVSRPGTLDTIKLSGCKNTSAARKAGEGLVEALDWGITLATTDPIPDDLAYVGVRAFYIKRVDEPETFDGDPRNIIPCVVDRISDSRFERTVMVKAQGYEGFTQRIQWKVDKLAVPADQLPERGDRVVLYFDPGKLYLVTE
ncbi:MAG: sulfate/molybdate ABC transporter ATP-binding protein [Coriobacteriia bacterium]|nr:sulfate/molybdate ABC transporter ATP-binding protein [Coriobacteriia bacterium]